MDVGALRVLKDDLVNTRRGGESVWKPLINFFPF
jgi:hypothetical protein